MDIAIIGPFGVLHPCTSFYHGLAGQQVLQDISSVSTTGKIFAAIPLCHLIIVLALFPKGGCPSLPCSMTRLLPLVSFNALFASSPTVCSLLLSVALDSHSFSAFSNGGKRKAILSLAVDSLCQLPMYSLNTIMVPF